MLGYFDAPEATAEKFLNGWFLTGDTGHVNEDGSITYHGRADDLINAGGFRVSPLEIESTLRQHPDITDCAVVEWQLDAERSIIAAFYAADHEISQNDLSAFASERLARYKQPRVYFFEPVIPKSGNGKLARKSLRERAPGFGQNR